MTVEYRQTDTAATHGSAAYCSGLSAAQTEVNKAASVGGAAGTATLTAQTNSEGTRYAVIWETDAVGDVGAWPASTATVRLNITTGNSNVSVTEVYLCRVNSSGTSQGTWGSSTGLTTSCTSGVKSWSVTTSEMTAGQGVSSTDRLVVVIGIARTGGHGGQSFDWQSDQLITTPFTAATVLTPSAQEATSSTVAPTLSRVVTVPTQEATTSAPNPTATTNTTVVVSAIEATTSTPSPVAGTFTPAQGVWRWYSDATPDGSMTALAAENMAPTLTAAQLENGTLRLRVRLIEQGGISGSDVAAALQYSHDDVEWSQLGDQGDADAYWFRYEDGAAVAGATVGSTLLSGASTKGKYHETAVGTESLSANGDLEVDFAIRARWPCEGSVSFRMVLGGTSVPLDTGASYPGVVIPGTPTRRHSITSLGFTDVSTANVELRQSPVNHGFYHADRFWVFHAVATGLDPLIRYRHWSGPGSEWSSEASFSSGDTSTNQGKIRVALWGATDRVYVLNGNNNGSSDRYLNRGTISGGTITWDGNTTVNAEWANDGNGLSLDDGGHIWVGGVRGTAGDQLWARRSTNADSLSAFESTHTVATPNTVTVHRGAACIGLASGKAIVIYHDDVDSKIKSATVSNDGFGTVTTAIASTAAHDMDWGVARGGGHVFLVHTDSASNGGDLKLRVFDESSETWSTATTPPTGTANRPIGTDDQVALQVCGDDLLVYFVVRDPLGGDDRVVKMLRYTGLGPSGTWDAAVTISEGDRGRIDRISSIYGVDAPAALCFAQFGYDGSATGIRKSPIQLEYYTLARPEVGAQEVTTTVLSPTVITSSNLSPAPQEATTSTGSVGLARDIDVGAQSVTTDTPAPSLDRALPTGPQEASTSTTAVGLSRVIQVGAITATTDTVAVGLDRHLTVGAQEVTTSEAAVALQRTVAVGSQEATTSSPAVGEDRALPVSGEEATASTGAVTVLEASNLTPAAQEVTTDTPTVGLARTISVPSLEVATDAPAVGQDRALSVAPQSAATDTTAVGEDRAVAATAQEATTSTGSVTVVGSSALAPAAQEAVTDTPAVGLNRTLTVPAQEASATTADPGLSRSLVVGAQEATADTTAVDELRTIAVPAQTATTDTPAVGEDRTLAVSAETATASTGAVTPTTETIVSVPAVEATTSTVDPAPQRLLTPAAQEAVASTVDPTLARTLQVPPESVTTDAPAAEPQRTLPVSAEEATATTGSVLVQGSAAVSVPAQEATTDALAPTVQRTVTVPAQEATTSAPAVGQSRIVAVGVITVTTSTTTVVTGTAETKGVLAQEAVTDTPAPGINRTIAVGPIDLVTEAPNMGPFALGVDGLLLSTLVLEPTVTRTISVSAQEATTDAPAVADVFPSITPPAPEATTSTAAPVVTRQIPVACIEATTEVAAPSGIGAITTRTVTTTGEWSKPVVFAPGDRWMVQVDGPATDDVSVSVGLHFGD